MKIEAKLAVNNMRKNKKRTLYTTISLILCTMLILTTLILISSIRNGVSENFETEYNDYHVILKDLSPERFNSIKNKPYIDKIYIQENENTSLEKVDTSYIPQENVTVYLKYNNIKNVCSYSENIIGSLGLSEEEARELYKICEFNNKLLTVNGFIDVTAIINNQGLPECRMRVNYSYVIDLMLIVVILVFSILFIIILYNAFLITINERKKEYAILNSIGGTEGQVLKMVFVEAIFMGIIGVIIGGILATISAKLILNSLNNILVSAGYYFRLLIEAKYIIFSLIIIAINIYLSVLIPSIKASSTSVIQGIRNNKQIKYKHKRKNSIIAKILPIEGRVAIKNVKRDKSKYRFITILLVVSITSFIAISTYLEYEKETADIVTEYDVDAEISFLPKYVCEYMGLQSYADYENILKNYEKQYNEKIEYIEYKRIYNEAFLIEPSDALLTDEGTWRHIDNTRSRQFIVIALDDKTYNEYIQETNANYGDIIIYNIVAIPEINGDSETYRYTLALQEDENLMLKLIIYKYPPIVDEDYYKATKKYIWDYEVIDENILNKNYVFTDNIVNGFKEIKNTYCPILFMNMDTYNSLDRYIEENYGKYTSYDEKGRIFWDNRDDVSIKIKCDNIIEFKNYMDEIIKDQNNGISFVDYYTLENAEKLLYIDIIELILKVVMVTVVSIGIISTINIMNASLIERKENFNILYRIGATKGNIKKILLYEGIYMFIKAVIISAILSIPIIYGIIKHMENVIILNKLLIPFGNIGIFIGILFVITIIITLVSTRMIKEE